MPKPVTRQTQMSTFLGKMPAVDSNGIIDNMAFKVNVVAKTADCTIPASESGTYYTDYGCTGTIEFTLPTVAAGLFYTFYSVAAGTMLVGGGAANIMVADNDATATSVQLASANDIIGGGFRVFSDGTKWFALPFGTELATVTIA